MNDNYKIRYSRHHLLEEVGHEGQLKLGKAKVLVVGAGGLGCPVLLYLAAAGVGTLGIVDGDSVSLSNLQRQVLYTTKDVGSLKAESAKNHLEALNPEITINSYPQFLDAESAITLIPQYDIVVDGTDRFDTRYLLNDACKLFNKPLVYGAIHRFEGQVSVFHYKGGPHYRCLFPKPPQADKIPTCNETGVFGVLPGMVGMVQANEVLKIILELGEVLSGKLWLYNAKKLIPQIIKFDYPKTADHLMPANTEALKKMDYQIFCGLVEVSEINVKDAIKKIENKEAVLLDIRKPTEMPRLELPHLVLDEIDLENTLKLKKEIVVMCQKGARSKLFVKHYKDLGYKNLISLKGGVERYDSNLAFNN